MSPDPGSLVGTARLATGASCGTVLLRDGRAYPLPGLDDDACSSTLAQVRGIARRTLLTGQVYRTFLWPDSAEGHGYLRVTALSATDGPALVLGTVLVTPDAGCQGLTRRELQVLGLVVAGRSNQQIAHRLGVTARTAAAHLEHILHKLQAPSRTDAAVRAEREGCYIPVG